MILKLLLFMSITAYSSDFEHQWNKVSSSDYESANNVGKFFRNPNVEITFPNDNFKKMLLMGESDVESFCKDNYKFGCPLVNIRKYLLLPMYSKPSLKSNKIGYKIIEIEKIAGRTISVKNFIPGTLNNSKLEEVIINGLPDTFELVLDHISLKDSNWILFPSTKENISTWVNDFGSDLFRKSNYWESYDEGIALLNIFPIIHNHCIVKIFNGKVHFKEFLYKPQHFEISNKNKFDTASIRDVRKYADDYSKDTDNFQDYIFEISLKDYFTTYKLFSAWPNEQDRSYFGKDKVSCENYIFLKDIPLSQRSSIFKKHQKFLEQSDFVKALMIPYNDIFRAEKDKSKYPSIKYFK